MLGHSEVPSSRRLGHGRCHLPRKNYYDLDRKACNIFFDFCLCLVERLAQVNDVRSQVPQFYCITDAGFFGDCRSSNVTQSFFCVSSCDSPIVILRLFLKFKWVVWHVLGLPN